MTTKGEGDDRQAGAGHHPPRVVAGDRDGPGRAVLVEGHDGAQSGFYAMIIQGVSISFVSVLRN